MASDSNPPKPSESFPIATLPGLSAQQIEDLRRHWITTVEELAGAAASPAARAVLAGWLELSAQDTERVLQQAQATLGAERYHELNCPQPAGSLGLVVTDQQTRNLQTE